MTEYVEKELLYKRLLEKSNDEKLCVYPGNLFIYALREVFSELPTADVVEVRHGEWIEKDDGWGGVLYTCSVCDCDWTTIDGTPFENNMRYCPECGAKMDGERRTEQCEKD